VREIFRYGVVAARGEGAMTTVWEGNQGLSAPGLDAPAKLCCLLLALGYVRCVVCSIQPSSGCGKRGICGSDV
jgi:hypothetical protein